MTWSSAYVTCAPFKVKDYAFILYHPVLHFTWSSKWFLFKATLWYRERHSQEPEALTLALMSLSETKVLPGGLTAFCIYKMGKPLSIIPSNANVCDSLISAQGYGDWITGFGEPYLILNTMRTGFLSLIESPETQCPAVTTDTLETHAKSLWSIPTTGVGLSKVLGLKP